MKKLFIPLVAVAALTVGASPALPASTATATVQIKRLSFLPTTAKIKTGDTVRCVNADPQTSFAQLATVLTTTNGAWNLVLTPSPRILTQFQAKWNARTSVTVGVQVRPRIRLSQRNGKFTTIVQSAVSHAGRSVLAQRLSRFGQWVTLKKVRLGGRSSAVFRLTLPKGKSRIRVAMSINQAGAGYLDGYSPTITVRRR